MTATYWAIGRSIVEEELRGAARAGYGEQLVVKLSRDLQARFRRGCEHARDDCPDGIWRIPGGG